MAVAAALSFAPGCNSGGGNHNVSSKLFLTPITAPTAGGGRDIHVLADRLDFLQATQPKKLPSELANTPTDPFVLGRLSTVDRKQADPAKQVKPSENLLVFEGQSRSVLSANMCPDGPTVRCGKVSLNYNTKGLDTVQQEGGIISTAVAPIKTKSGWIMTFDTSSKNIIAFREEAPREYLDAQGQSHTIKYHSAERTDGTVNPDSKNFGQGEGVLLSVVISGEDLADQLNIPAEPIVTRLFEIEDNKVLVFFASTVVRAVQLLDLTEETQSVSFDLDDPANPQKRLDVQFLRGTFKFFPDTAHPFLPFSAISDLTGMVDVEVDSFQPVLIPGSHVALLFERFSSTFLLVAAAHGPTGDITGSALGVAIFPDLVRSVLQAESGISLSDTKFTMSGGFPNPEAKKPELLIFEEVTNNLLAYDYKASPSSNLRTFSNSSNLTLRRDPSGTSSFDSSAEPVLDFATADVTANRLLFEQGLDQLLSISYTSGVWVIVANNTVIAQATGDPLSEIKYIEPLNENEVRAFDTHSCSLLDIKLQYAALPVSVD